MRAFSGAALAILLQPNHVPRLQKKSKKSHSAPCGFGFELADIPRAVLV